MEEMIDATEPYRIFEADLLSCPVCRYEIVSGFGSKPIAEHFMATYKRLAATVFTRFWCRVQDIHTPISAPDGMQQPDATDLSRLLDAAEELDCSGHEHAGSHVWPPVGEYIPGSLADEVL